MSVADVVGAVCTPVGQHVGVTWGDGWRKAFREIWHLGVAVKGSQSSGMDMGGGQDVGVAWGLLLSRRNHRRGLV